MRCIHLQSNKPCFVHLHCVVVISVIVDFDGVGFIFGSGVVGSVQRYKQKNYENNCFPRFKGSRFFIIRHIHNHTSIISSEMQVELKKNTAFT